MENIYVFCQAALPWIIPGLTFAVLLSIGILIVIALAYTLILTRTLPKSSSKMGLMRK